jgi:hypothetical protein
MIGAGRDVAKRILGRRGLAISNDLALRARFVRRFGLRFLWMSRFKTVDGFLPDEEAVRLYVLAARLPGRAPVVVELGSWVGKSAVVLGTALRRRRGATLVCVDPFDGSGDAPSLAFYESEKARLGGQLREMFEQNTRRAGLARVIDMRQGRSAEVVRQWRRPIDMLFIDASHDYEDVRHDFLQWSRFVRPGGIVALHDVHLEPGGEAFEAFPGPARVVEECLLPDSSWERIEYVGALFVARKTVAGPPSGGRRD